VTTGGALTATYAYDGDGYRTKKVVGATTNTYAWDCLGAGGRGAVVGDDQAEYMFGPAGLQQRTVGAASQYAGGDGLGSVRGARVWGASASPASRRTAPRIARSSGCR